MASITIRNLDDEVKRRLRIRGAANGRSMEEEAGKLLRAALGDADLPVNLGRQSERVSRLRAGPISTCLLATRRARRRCSIRADLVGRKESVTFEPLALKALCLKSLIPARLSVGSSGNIK
ncbi:FitA-like ribbon-helix-helix domain-containing protein [Natronospira sp.]|uniref:FitA-like ribbon-helix-helix domain-containing protein n=1 Tax=Natronospira sp. TaxID=2024970 RepID=UPI0038739C49